MSRNRISFTQIRVLLMGVSLLAMALAGSANSYWD